MTRIFACLGACVLVLVFAGCGGDDDDGAGASQTLVLTPNLAELPAGADADETINETVDILRARAADLRIEATVELQDDNRISVEATTATPEEAEEIFTRTALLSIAQPALGPVGQVLCRTANGVDISVPRENVGYPPAGSPDRGTPRCLVGDGTFAEILWVPASADLSGQDTELTGEFVDEAILDTTQGPIVIVSFNESGSLLLTSISEEIIGLPMGVFIDDELVAAPTVGERIITGNIAISGLSEVRGRILAAQLRAGPLPVPLSADDDGG
jgi:preprotein translocase subunit SecD